MRKYRPPLFEFMPYGAPELQESAVRHLSRAIALSGTMWTALFFLSMWAATLIATHPIVQLPHEPGPILEPPPLVEHPMIAEAVQTSPPAADQGIVMPVPDINEPPDIVVPTTSTGNSGTSTVETSGDHAVVVLDGNQGPPRDEKLPPRDLYVDELPYPLRQVKPAYPEIAIQAGIQGDVVIEVLVWRDGSIRQIRVVRSIPVLDAAALEAIGKWQFSPAITNDRPVSSWVRIPIKFRLH